MVEGSLPKHKDFSPKKNLAMNLRPVCQIAAASSTLTFPVSSTIKVTFQKHEISYLVAIKLFLSETFSEPLASSRMPRRTSAIYLQARFVNKAQFKTPKAWTLLATKNYDSFLLRYYCVDFCLLGKFPQLSTTRLQFRVTQIKLKCGVEFRLGGMIRHVCQLWVQIAVIAYISVIAKIEN